MARNLYFSEAVKSEQELFENIVIESLKMYGSDVYYIPRDLVNEDAVFKDDVSSSFNSSYKVEMYIENTDGFDGEGDLFTKFGVEIRDQATFVVARRRWNDTVSKYDNDINSLRPREGDLVYLPMSKSMFQIMQVEHEQPFYQLRDLPTYKLRCELFEYNSEEFDTGVDAIDVIERDFAYRYNVTFTQSTGTVFTTRNGTTLNQPTISSSGSNYLSDPTITFSNNPQPTSLSKFGNSALHTSNNNNTSLSSYSALYSGTYYRGFMDFWVYIESLPGSGEYSHILSTGVEDEKTRIGIDENGRIVAISIAEPISSLVIYDDDIGNNPVLTEGSWHHVRLAIRGPNIAVADRDVQLYIDGVRVFYTIVNNLGSLFGEDYLIGSDVNVDGVNFGSLAGYIDDFYINAANPDISTTITVPTAAYASSIANTITYESFDLADPTVSITRTNNQISNIVLTDIHNYYHQAPTLTLSAPDNISYTIGETVTQTLVDGTIINGEVSAFNSSNFNMSVVNLGSTDGKYHTISTALPLVGATSETSAFVATIVEENTLSANEQNDDFETEADAILDFTETNPFGDPS